MYCKPLQYPFGGDVQEANRKAGVLVEGVNMISSGKDAGDIHGCG